MVAVLLRVHFYKVFLYFHVLYIPSEGAEGGFRLSQRSSAPKFQMPKLSERVLTSLEFLIRPFGLIPKKPAFAIYFVVGFFLNFQLVFYSVFKVDHTLVELTILGSYPVRSDILNVQHSFALHFRN